ncbi:MAG TPA: hypothetical protein DIT99_02350, partial [Candidatus Latescibacteria bacterium]|nr:hypothetical protein [Candidatus Latescibacterota bacterium]
MILKWQSKKAPIWFESVPQYSVLARRHNHSLYRRPSMELIEFIINVYMLAFGLRLFMPSASSFSEHPIQRGLYASTEPVLRPIRQMMIRGEPRFDWSPLFAI